MKKNLILSFLLLEALYASSQSVAVDPVATKFTSFFKSNQPDSIFNLYSDKMKEALKVEGNRTFVQQIKSQLGEITGVKNLGAVGSNIYEYRLSFEKPIVELALSVQNNLIIGIHQKQVEASNEAPDNFNIKGPSGTLYGTLVLPGKSVKTPVVLFIGGSGATDRNMNQGKFLQTNSFLKLADSLARRGVASVRYDKRGVGKSVNTLKGKHTLLDDFVDDAVLFVNELKADPRFSNVIIAGHSEGSAIGILAAQKTSSAAFISLCGAAGNIGTVLRKQLKMLSDGDYKIATQVLDSLAVGKLFTGKLPESLNGIFNPAIQPFIISSMKYNSTTELKKLKMPILIVGGTSDAQIATEDAQQLLVANPKATLSIIEGMNHVLKNSAKSDTETYLNPKFPIHKDLLQVLTSFIDKLKN